MQNPRIQVFSKSEAQNLLDTQGPNRAVSTRHVDDLASSMNRGDWFHNSPQGLIVEENTQKLLDGQHRLAAFIKSNLTTISFWVHETSAKARLTLDSGRARSTSDNLRILGEKHPVQLAAAVRILRQWLEGDSGLSNKILPRVIAPAPRGVRTPEAVSIGDKYPELKDAIAFVMSNKTAVASVCQSQAAFAVLVYLFRKTTYGPAIADEFVARLLDGQDLTATSPVLAARNQLVSRLRTRGRTFAQEAAIIVLAWNDFVVGKTRKSKYLWNGEFPVISGKPLGVSDRINGP